MGLGNACGVLMGLSRQHGPGPGHSEEEEDGGGSLGVRSQARGWARDAPSPDQRLGHKQTQGEAGRGGRADWSVAGVTCPE